jgi:alanine-synthesizing transaminase
VFSSRIPANLAANRLAEALGAARASGRALVDLTLSNPTRAGLDYPADLLTGLGDPRALHYDPRAAGALEAREAVAADYARQGLPVPPARIVLTASTSDAYTLIFKLLADAGDEVLVPRPSYPLFDHLTRLDLVVARPYDLDIHGLWSIDLESVERALTPRTRAVLVVSPNNPTGSFVSRDELDHLAALCAPRQIAIIADEVFADYELQPGASSPAGRVAARDDVLSFALGGLSKSVGLPQVKLGWIAVSGPAALVCAALERLELVCDTYLSVSTPVQIAAASLLARGAAIRSQIAARVTANYRSLQDAVAAVPSCRVLESAGGWYAVLQVPTLESEEDLVVRLLTDDDVLVHPGYFFDFPRESFLIVSLLPAPATFADGVARVLRRAGDPATARP